MIAPRRGHVLLLGGSGMPELRVAAERRGLGVAVLTVPELLDAALDRPAVEHAEAVDFAQPLAVLRRILALAEELDLRAVVPVIEYGLEVGAIAAHRLGLPTNTLAAVRATRDKLKMRRLLAAAGIDRPRWAPARTPDDIVELLAAVGGPVIVKPGAGSGSDGIVRVERPEQAQEALEWASSSLVPGPVLCEECVEGPEISLEGYSVDGRFVPLAVTDKHVGAAYVESGHDQPTAWPDDVTAAAAELTGRALEVLGVTTGVSHTEMILGTSGPVLVETHTRMGGGAIHRLCREAWDVDLCDIHLGLALGERVEAAPRATGRAAAVRFLAGGSGTVATVEMPPAAPDSGIVWPLAYVRPGSDVPARASSRARLAHAVAVAETPAEAARRATDYLAAVRVTYAAATNDEVA